MSTATTATNDLDFADWSAQQPAAPAAARKIYLKIAEGDTVIRILPGTKAYPHPFVELKEHSLPLNQGDRRRVICPQHNAWLAPPSPCAICDYATELETQRNYQAAKTYAADSTIKCNAYNVDDMADGVKIYSPPFSVYDYLLGLNSASTPAHRRCDFTHPLTGRDIMINRIGRERTNTRYRAYITPTATPISTDREVIRSILSQRYDFRTFFRVPTTDAVAEIFRTFRK